MLEGLQTEIDLHQELTGASPRIVVSALNAPGTAITEYTVLSPTPVMISKSDLFIVYLGQASRCALDGVLSGDTVFGKDVKMVFDEVEGKGINLALSAVRTLMTGLHAVGVGNLEEYSRLMSKGEVLASRADELFGRKITLEDF